MSKAVTCSQRPIRAPRKIAFEISCGSSDVNANDSKPIKVPIPDIFQNKENIPLTKETVFPVISIFSPNTKLTVAKDYIKRGKRLFQEENYTESILLFKKANTLIPENEKLVQKIKQLTGKQSNNGKGNN